jgi:fatty-acid peroxygenase
MEATAPHQVHALVREATRTWHAMTPRWNGRTFTLYEALQEWLARAVCAWAGVPLPEEEVALRTAQLTALFDKAASGVGAHFAARRARRETEAWLIQLVKAQRTGRPALRAQSVAAATALLRDARGELLPPRIAAVELINLLRPTVAVSVFVVFVAHAMHLNPEWARKLREATADETLAFVQEVRRFYPFFPAVAARVAVPFVWDGYRFPQGMRTMLDLYGTNHDPRAWGTPDEFHPEHFMGAAPTRPFAFVPQGGGRAEDHHRCPGESITVELMQLGAQLLARECRYRVPEQHLWVQMGRMPALPASRFIVTDFQAI